MTNYPQYVWFHDEEAGNVKHALLLSRGAHVSKIQYRANGLDWQVVVSNDDIEFIGDDAIDDDD